MYQNIDKGGFGLSKQLNFFYEARPGRYRIKVTSPERCRVRPKVSSTSAVNT